MMSNFLIFSLSRRLAKAEAGNDVSMPSLDGDWLTIENPPGWKAGDDLAGVALIDDPTAPNGLGYRAEVNPALALATAQALSREAIRTAARAVLEQLDIRHNARLGELRINRTDPARIEAYYTTLLEQQQVRDSSNAAQDAATSATTPSAAWTIVDSLDLYSAPIGQLSQNITKYAFIARLNLTHAEKQNPYIAGLQADLLALTMVNIPFVGVELKKLVGAGVLTQSRVDAVLNAPIAWTERETNF